MKTIHIPIKNDDYNVYIEDGLLNQVHSYIKKNKQYVLITDCGIPKEYIDVIQSSIDIKQVLTFKQGEAYKTLDTVALLIEQLQELHITRDDCLIALGGGIVGDVTGFVASIYLRGIDYYNIPTTLLSQIDSSIGGKVGVNSKYAKNAIGQFKQPKAVFIDPVVLKTLDKRQFNNGVSELIKHAIIKDADLFDDLLNKDFNKHLNEFIFRSLNIKKEIVIQDVYDKSIRQLLNFGHTIAHAIEKASHHQLYHGEAVAIGMAKMSKDCNRHKDIIQLLEKFDLPTDSSYQWNQLMPFMLNDKKLKQEHLSLVIVNNIGDASIKQGHVSDLKLYY